MPARFLQRSSPWGMVFFSPSILSPSSQTHPALPQAPVETGGPYRISASTVTLLFCISLAFGRASLFLSSLLVAFSQGYVFYILNFKRFQGRICVSQKSSICLKCSDLAVTITKQQKPICEERFFGLEGYFHFGCNCQRGFHSYQHYISPLQLTSEQPLLLE